MKGAIHPGRFFIKKKWGTVLCHKWMYIFCTCHIFLLTWNLCVEGAFDAIPWHSSFDQLRYAVQTPRLRGRCVSSFLLSQKSLTVRASKNKIKFDHFDNCKNEAFELFIGAIAHVGHLGNTRMPQFFFYISSRVALYTTNQKALGWFWNGACAQLLTRALFLLSRKVSTSVGVRLTPHMHNDGLLYTTSELVESGSLLEEGRCQKKKVVKPRPKWPKMVQTGCKRTLKLWRMKGWIKSATGLPPVFFNGRQNTLSFKVIPLW